MLASQRNETFQLEAADPRADGRLRHVMLSRDLIVISRRREGVAMRITLKPRAYRGVLLRLTGCEAGRLAYEVSLEHADPDLSVALAHSDDEFEARRAWREWARFVAAPALVERVEGQYETVNLGRAAGPERRRRGVGARRPRFLARRKVGSSQLGGRCERTAELFGGWRVEEL